MSNLCFVQWKHTTRCWRQENVWSTPLGECKTHNKFLFQSNFLHVWHWLCFNKLYAFILSDQLNIFTNAKMPCVDTELNLSRDGTTFCQHKVKYVNTVICNADIIWIQLLRGVGLVPCSKINYSLVDYIKPRAIMPHIMTAPPPSADAHTACSQWTPVPQSSIHSSGERQWWKPALRTVDGCFSLCQSGFQTTCWNLCCSLTCIADSFKAKKKGRRMVSLITSMWTRLWYDLLKSPLGRCSSDARSSPAWWNLVTWVWSQMCSAILKVTLLDLRNILFTWRRVVCLSLGLFHCWRSHF